MKQYKKRIIEDIVCVETVCNKCGYKSENKTEIQSFKLNWGYSSPFDLEVWEFELCPTCLTELINSFKIPMEKKLEWF